MAMDNFDLLTVGEASALLRLKVSTVRAWLLKRRVPFVKLGGRVFLKRSDCIALVEAGHIAAVPATGKAGAA
ncbi:helix-turn-helix domain-containing protein [Granulicella aggregans]|uniref:helix-turn-helix domain-containing protein n=1 Tax=Granulicella aggregans TaxID=474949 RepID=UPI0037BE560D